MRAEQHLVFNAAIVVAARRRPPPAGRLTAGRHLLLGSPLIRRRQSCFGVSIFGVHEPFSNTVEHCGLPGAGVPGEGLYFCQLVSRDRQIVPTICKLM